MAYLLQQTDEYIESLIEMVRKHKDELKKLKKRRKSSRRATVTEVKENTNFSDTFYNLQKA